MVTFKEKSRILINKKNNESKCKGLYFRGKVSSFTTSYDSKQFKLGVRKEVILLKRMSCPGCKKCGWITDYFHEDVANDSLLDYIGEIENNKIYTIKIHGDYEGVDYIEFVKVPKEQTEQINK